MLKEIEGVRQDEPGRARRWFHDDDFDLFVWQSPTGEVLMFQLCYGGASSDRALVWREDLGFFHDGEPPGAGEPLLPMRSAAASRARPPRFPQRCATSCSGRSTNTR